MMPEAHCPLPASAPYSVTGLPAFNDNYIWVIHASALPGPVVVDPGDAAPVIAYCREAGVFPSQIWLTHHHADHVGGVAGMVDWMAGQGRPLTVYGPSVEAIPGVTQSLQGGEAWTLCAGLHVRALDMPGHTRGHIAYLLEAETQASGSSAPALFCGDVLFGLGCGRLFEGTAAQMYASLSQFRALPPATRIYCAHEYTLMNLPFAEAVDPANPALRARAATIRQQRSAGLSTVPLLLADEWATNPFLRSDQDALRDAAMLPEGASAVAVFARLREMRDTFKAR